MSLQLRVSRGFRTVVLSTRGHKDDVNSSASWLKRHRHTNDSPIKRKKEARTKLIISGVGPFFIYFKRHHLFVWHCIAFAEVKETPT